MSDRQGVEIDYCPQCRGVWLDRGELDKILERSVTAESAPTPTPTIPSANPAPSPWAGDRSGHDQRGYDPRGHAGGYGDHGHDPHYRGKRKKSFLQELFD